jgi:DNA replication protein DnaC
VAYSAVRTGLHVYYTEADELLAALVQAPPAEKKKLLKPLLDADLLVLDDLFMARRIPQDAADQLQSIVHKRYKLRRSLLITSNRIIVDWTPYLGDSALASTILDRLMHRSVLVEFKGRSYRLKEAAARLAKADASE